MTTEQELKMIDDYHENLQDEIKEQEFEPQEELFLETRSCCGCGNLTTDFFVDGETLKEVGICESCK